jgi:hypothetical protein
MKDINVNVKGIVSRVWGGLLMVGSVELKFKLFQIKFIFNLNVVFTLSCLKMALSRVRFSPGFPPGAVFSREQSHHR